MDSEAYWNQALQVKVVSDTMKVFIKNLYIPYKISESAFLQNLWSDHLIFSKAIVMADVLEKANINTELTDDKVKYHWDWPNVINDLNMFYWIPEDIRETIINKFCYLNLDLFVSTNGFFENEIKYLPTPTLSFAKHFCNVNNFRTKKEPVGLPRYFIVGFPDVAIWYFQIFENRELANYFRSVIAKMPMPFNILDYHKTIIDEYCKQTGIRQLECAV